MNMLGKDVLTFGAEQITAPVKLLIWDLDDTFWRGTLSEGPVEMVPANIEVLKVLLDRGIISSICSKNDHEAARAALEARGAWDLFVFSKIDFSPKGPRVAALIEEMNLRPVNVLFIDDNPVNLREVAYTVPGVMAVHPNAVLPALLEHRFLQGKPDPARARLTQYKQLECKVADHAQTTLSNEAFLRSCGIRINFIYDLEPHIDRVIELIDRSNQLNYTKKSIGAAGREAFVTLLRQRDVYAGAVAVADRYGDYGIAGFFLQVKDPLNPRLEQFVFSCRIMNMGVEQFVYEHLGCPPLAVVPPVAYPVRAFAAVDWIAEAQDGAAAGDAATDQRLLLIGGCDLLQVASYCSRQRAEFVNGVQDGVVVRYDDFGFVLSDRARLEHSQVLTALPCWTAEQARALDRELAVSEVVVISLWVALRGRYLATNDGVVVRVHPHGLGEVMDAGRKHELTEKAGLYRLSPTQNEALLKSAILTLAARAPLARCHVLLGANTRVIDREVRREDRAQRVLYNRVCQELASQTEGLAYVGIDDLVPVEHMLDDWHYTRKGYLMVAEAVKRLMTRSRAPAAAVPAPAMPVWDEVRRGKKISFNAILGPDGYAPVTAKRRLKRALQAHVLGQTALEWASAARRVTSGRRPAGPGASRP